MKCIRCNKEFNSDIPETNVEIYGDKVYYACPHCGKLYSFRRKITILIDEVNDSNVHSTEDDWSKSIIKDCDYVDSKR